MPLTVLLLLALYWVMVKWLFPNHIRHSESGKLFIQEELKKLGRLTIPEKRVCVVFGFTVFLWIFKDILNSLQALVVLDDTMIAMIGAVLLFIVPSGRSSSDREQRLLEWSDTQKMAWGILLLFGGGIALAKALEEVKIMDQLGTYIASFSTTNVFVLVLVVTTLSVFLSEIMSNVAQVIVLAPVISTVGLALHIDPMLLGIPMTLGASCASMLPMGTPPNAIVFASGYIQIKDMMKIGFVMNLICILLITLFCWLLQPYLISLPH
jgi:sodium-dependent dicarboxylate transporter 2/3/5